MTIKKMLLFASILIIALSVVIYFEPIVDYIKYSANYVLQHNLLPLVGAELYIAYYILSNQYK